MYKKVLVGFATAAALSFGSAAQAATIDVTAQNSTNVYSNADGSQQLSIKSNYRLGRTTVSAIDVGVLQLTGTEDNGNSFDFLAVTLDPTEGVNFASEYTPADGLSDLVAARLNALAANAWSLVSNKRRAAAFQMAAWEIVNETNQDRGLNLNNGIFSVSGTTDTVKRSKTIAQKWLASITDGTFSDTSSFGRLESADSAALQTDIAMQNAGVNNTLVNVVPLPASAWMLLGGLVGAGAIARRRKG